MIFRDYVNRKMKKEGLYLKDIAAQIGLQRMATLYNLMRVPAIGERGPVPIPDHVDDIVKWSKGKVTGDDWYERRKK